MRFEEDCNVYKLIFKRVIDLVFSLIAFVLLLPLFLLLLIVLTIVNHGTPFFSQFRPGKNEKRFKVIKFKTMTDRRDRDGTLLDDDHRLTKVGKFVRRTSMDEIPQLLNVIVGDMSLIGPRPLLTDYLPYYDSFQKRRHEVKPGITGWAQINGRNLLNWDKRFEFDIWYIDHVSFLVDMKILFQTFFKVIRSEGISAQGHATMPNFIDFLETKSKFKLNE